MYHRSRFTLILGLFVALLAAKTARAQTINVSSTWMNFTSTPSDTQASQYSGLISSLRNAAATSFRNGVMITPTTSSEQSANLITMQLTDVGRTDPDTGQNPTMTLWFTADNLYLRGFTNTQGQTFYFNEPSTNGNPGYSLPQAFESTSQGQAFGPAGWMTGLGMSSNYNSLTQASGLNRSNISLGWPNFYNAFYTLAYYGVNGNSSYSGCAASLLLMIQYSSEAARFNDVYGFTSVWVQRYAADNESTSLPLWMQYMENSWAQISNYGWQDSQYAGTAPLNVTGMNPDNSGNSYTFNSFGDVQRFIAVMLNNDEVYDPEMGSYWGDWKHDEL
ncbi:MAG: hypothetical protein JWQ49_83 [Edaphobacter sp.]|nr:hypothetical protein [Edaphobacter sp.]